MTLGKVISGTNGDDIALVQGLCLVEEAVSTCPVAASTSMKTVL